MSKARQKGTAGENFFLGHLRAVFGDHVERAPLKGVLDHGDFIGVPYLHEAKNTQRPNFLEWARIARKKAAGEPWAVLWKGDLRKGDGPYVLVPLEHYDAMATAWWVQYQGKHLTVVDL